MEALNTQCSASILLKSRRLEEERLIYERELMAARLREEENVS